MSCWHGFLPLNLTQQRIMSGGGSLEKEGVAVPPGSTRRARIDPFVDSFEDLFAPINQPRLGD